MIKKIYVDLDGVLADFEGYFTQVFGDNIKKYTDDEMWAKIDQYDKEWDGWFLDLPKMRDADTLWKYLNTLSGIKIYILSAISKDHPTFDERSLQKKMWAVDNFHVKMSDVFVVGKSEWKGQYADEESILIDDSTRSTNAFEENGGTAMLHTSANDTINQLKKMFNNAGMV